MNHEEPSESRATTSRYRVRRPTLQRAAGWTALASGAAIPLLIWFASLPPHQQGVLAIILQQPLMGLLLVFAVICVLFLVTIVSAVYWMKAEHTSDSFPWRRGHGTDEVSPYPRRGASQYQRRREWHS